MIDLKSLLVPVVSSVLALTALAAPARAADPYGIQASSAPGIIFEECTDHPISYSVTPPPEAWSWNIQMVLQSPDGTGAGSATVTSDEPTTGVTMVQFCGADDIPGTYTVTGTYTTFVGMTVTRTPVAPFTFDMRMPLSTVAATPSDRTPRRGQLVNVRVQVTDERPGGTYGATEGARVVLQRSKGDRWVKVSGAKGYTKSDGLVRLRFRHHWKGRSQFRVFSNPGYPERAASPAFVLRTKR